MTKNASHLIDAIGQDTLQKELGLTERNIRHFRGSGKFSAQWFAAIKDLAEARGLICPLEAFTFKAPLNQSGDISAAGQATDGGKCAGDA